MRIGANYLGNGKCEFVVWAPFLRKLSLKILSPQARILPMQKDKKGYWKSLVEDVSPQSRYLYQLGEKKDLPDPASHFQPEGVHGPSQVVDHQGFSDACWKGISLAEMIIYELHVGTFTPEGSFEAIIPRLDDLANIGITAIEIMPIAQFPGERNWGYDGVYPFAVQNSYGGPLGLKRLVNESHQRGIAVILDVVYNHLGPEGNVLRDYGPYFSPKYQTPWGEAVNFDGAHSDEVRNFFIQNALHWFNNYHLDALRLDAVHAIFDMSARPFLVDLAEEVKKFSSRSRKKFYLIAESDLNDPKLVRHQELGGYGLDACWCDDFHHALHTLLTDEQNGYYLDFGQIEDLSKSLREGFVYSGQYSHYRARSHGSSSRDRKAKQMIVFSQNHDQIGNRMFGERLSKLLDFESLKLAAGVLLLSPFIPLLFMGEEYGESAPFLYFVNHADPGLIEAVRKGRKKEFKKFAWSKEPPDPQSFQTFMDSKIHWEDRKKNNQKICLNFYQKIIKLRKETPALANSDKDNMDVCGQDKLLFMRRWANDSHILCIFNFNRFKVKTKVSSHQCKWEKILDSAERLWHGPGALLPQRINFSTEVTISGRSLAVYRQQSPLLEEP